MVSNDDRDAMKKILNALDGDKTALKTTKSHTTYDDDLLGPGYISPKAITAMADVLSKLNNVTSQIATESMFNSQLKEAINTQRTNIGVKIGNYQITIKEDKHRIAGKQYYGIFHTQSGDTIVDDLSLYETALNVVNALNSRLYVNSMTVRNLFDADDRYSAHSIEALRFKSRAKSAKLTGDYNKEQLYENRYQDSIRKAMLAKKDIKRIISEGKIKKTK